MEEGKRSETLRFVVKRYIRHETLHLLDNCEFLSPTTPKGDAGDGCSLAATIWKAEKGSSYSSRRSGFSLSRKR